jgi:DNA modification methylase
MSKQTMNQLIVGHAASAMASMPTGSIDAIICSPSYWTAVSHGPEHPWRSYQDYLADLQIVWVQCARVLRRNGKLCINAPLMPIPKDLMPGVTRHLKDIAGDIGRGIVEGTDLQRYETFIWQKQTSKLMLGAYPFPGNSYACNTIEFINVYVKPGKAPNFEAAVKAANKMTIAEHRDLTQQVWFMYPQDVGRREGHPAPFPEKLPARLIRLFTFGAAGDFPGEVVLDPFVGTGTTCVVAKRMSRQFIGIDTNPAYIEIARERIESAERDGGPLLLVGFPKYATRDELEALSAAQPGTAGREAEAKHKRKTYGRKVPMPAGDLRARDG